MSNARAAMSSSAASGAFGGGGGGGGGGGHRNHHAAAAATVGSGGGNKYGSGGSRSRGSRDVVECDCNLYCQSPLPTYHYFLNLFLYFVPCFPTPTMQGWAVKQYNNVNIINCHQYSRSS